MEEKIKKIIGALEYAELLQLQRDLDSGAFFMQQIVNQKVREIETISRKICATCGKDMHAEKDEMYTLLFGEKTIKKKASFCGIDCLENFTEILKDHRFASLRNINRRV